MAGLVPATHVLFFFWWRLVVDKERKTHARDDRADQAVEFGGIVQVGADIEAPATAVAIPDTVNGHVLTHQWMIIRRSNKRRGRPEQAWTSPAMTVGGCNGACRYRIGVASSLGRSLPTQRLV